MKNSNLFLIFCEEKEFNYDVVIRREPVCDSKRENDLA